MARKFSLGDFIRNRDGENKTFHKFKAIKSKWKANLSLGNVLRKNRTDTSIQKLKDDVSMALEGDIESLRRVKEYTLKRKQQLSVVIPQEEIHFLQDADFIHQILTECDQITPPPNVFDSTKVIPITKVGSGGSVVRTESKLNSYERDELYMLSVIAFDLISLEESQKSPIHMSKAETGFNESLTLMQDVLQLPKQLVKELEEKAHKGAVYGFDLSVFIHQAQYTKMQITEPNQLTELYCRVGYMSKEVVELRKLDLETKGTHVHTTITVPNSPNPIWDEQYKLPLLSKADYLLLELWRAKDKKKSDEYLGRCLIKLDSHMEEIVEQVYEFTSNSGKLTDWTILLSMKIIANASQTKFIAKYDISQKLDIFLTFTTELTHYLSRNNHTLYFKKCAQPFERIKNKITDILGLNHFQVTSSAFECSELWSKSKQLNQEDIEMSMGILNCQWEKPDNILTMQQRSNLNLQMSNLFEQETRRLEHLLIEFPPNQLESKKHLDTIISNIIGSYTFLLNRNVLNSDYDINKEITKKLMKGINNWYKDTSQAILTRSSTEAELGSLVTLCDAILHLIETSDMSYKDSVSAANTNFSNLIIFTIDTRLCTEIGNITKRVLMEEPKIGQEFNKLYFTSFLVYRKVALMLKRVLLAKSALDTFELSAVHELFRPFLNHWILALMEVSIKSIETTIEIETDETHLYRGIKVSSSAIDIGLCLLPSYIFYSKLEDWPDIQDRLLLALQVIQLNVDALLKYNQKMSGKIEKLVANPNLQFELNTEIGILLNNCYSVRYYLEEAPERIHWEKLKSCLEEENQKNAIGKLIEGCLVKIQASEFETIQTIGKVYKSQFTSLYREFISSVHSGNTTEIAIDDLMKWLLRNINVAIQSLCPDLFIPLLEEMWRQSLNYISKYKDPNKSKGNSNKILESLVILYEFFDNDGEGIGTEKVGGTTYDSLIDHFSLYIQDSHELMMVFGTDVSEFCQQAPDKRGSCDYSVAYLIDKELLEINIIQIENIPSPSTSSSVSIYLQAVILPKYDAKVYECKTELKKYDSSMVIDEVMSIPVASSAMDSGFILQMSLYYRSSHKLGLYSDYGGSIFLISECIGQMKSTGSLVDLLTGKNEVRKPIKMSFVDPGESEVLAVLRERRNEDIVVSSFFDSVTKGTKEGSVQRKTTDGVEGTKKFLNKLRK